VLLDAKAKIDAKDNRDWTALHFASDRGHQGVAQLLIDRGADRNARNRDGKAPPDLKLNYEDRGAP
jgi:ankyrin repeat protein